MRGIADKVKRKAILESYRERSDILILQETHSIPEIENIWAKEWGGDVIYNHGTNMSKGIAIFLKKGLKEKISNIFKCNQGRTIIFDFQDNDHLITVVAIYAPNSDTPAFFETISNQLEERSEHKIIVGDFNLTLDVDLDRKNTYHNNNNALDRLVDIMDHYNLRDVWRIHNGDRREYSWFKTQQNLQKASRIDYALLSAGLDQKAKAFTYLPSIMSDHRPLYFVIDLDYDERGAGYWKFNTKLLQEKEFIILINNEIDRTISMCSQKTACHTWETIKRMIKKISIDYTKNSSSESKLIISALTEKVNEYQSMLPLNREDAIVMQNTLQELEEKTLERAKSMIFRSKVRWHELGEKNTKYFFSLEKARYNAKTCYKVIDDNGHEYVKNHEILNIQKQYYAKLYDVDEDVDFTLTNNSGIKVPQNIREQQDHQISQNEIEDAIKSMNNGKTPGEDGIPIEIYKLFWRKIKKTFMEMILEIFETGTLHKTAREGILNLIPKPNKDARYIKNLRPITLLNVDYKIIEKAIALKMEPALKHIIHKDQRGFMKDRRISVNIRKMLDIIHYAKTEDIEAVILSLDFVKCFDKCSFSILHGSLEYFGFGEMVKLWTQILYKDFTVKIQNNGHFYNQIPIKKGIHQGGCCSSLYFLVIAEILAIALRDNEDIEGITIKDIKNLLNQFADDMDIFTLCSEKSIHSIYDELNKFHYQSGFTVSYDKTTLYRIGSLRHTNAQMYNLTQYSWSNQDINVLGVTISHNELLEINYSKTIKKVKETLNCWHNRGLSLIGKVQVVNTLVASLFVYRMMVLPKIPEKYIKLINNLIKEYLWNGGKSKIAFSILQNNKWEGGLNLVNLSIKDKSLKATWPFILRNEPDYANMVYATMRCSDLKENVWRCNLKKKDVKYLKIRNEFWNDVLEAWCDFNQSYGNRQDNQIIWYNSDIRIKNRPFFWRDTYQRGLIYVGQLFDENGFKEYSELYDLYGLSQMRLNSIKAALPKELKLFYVRENPLQYRPVYPHKYDQLVIQDTVKGSISQKIYKTLNANIFAIHGKYLKWFEELGPNFCSSLVHFGKNHMNIYRTTNIPKFRSFQYRLCQRAIVTNSQLYKWGIKESEMCTFCSEEKENIIHLFCQCPHIKTLWVELEKYLWNEYHVEINLTDQAIIFNTIVDKVNHIANFICLVMKHFIYKKRCLMQKLDFVSFLASIKNIEYVEKYIAVKNDNLQKHYKKWYPKQECENMSIDEYIRDHFEKP